MPNPPCASAAIGYDGGDCCSCTCGTMVTETEVNGTTQVETIYNGTLTLEVTYPNGTTTVHVEGTDQTTEFECGFHSRYRCIDPSSGCADDDDWNSMTQDDDWGNYDDYFGGDDYYSSMCDVEGENCVDNEECYMCLESASSSSSSELTATCPLLISSCQSLADFYCCAIPEMMDEGCDDNPELVSFFGCWIDAYYGYDCRFDEVDSFCDYVATDDDDDYCSDLIEDCWDDEDCRECVWGSSSDDDDDDDDGDDSTDDGDNSTEDGDYSTDDGDDSTDDDDDFSETCPEPMSSDTCADWADFYCCAIEETDGCEENDALLELIDCTHEHDEGAVCGFEDSVCDYDDFSGASASRTNLYLSGPLGAAVAGLVAVF
eukprot:g19340.t1